MAVVGLGAVARAVHLPILKKIQDHFEVAAICDISPVTLSHCGERFGIGPDQRFSDLEEMLESVETEALMVLTSGSHSREVLSGLRSGLTVFSEKPLAYTAREAKEIGDALSGSGDRLMVGYMKLYDPAVQAAVELVRERGPARVVDVTVLHPSAGAQLANTDFSPVGSAPAPDAARAVAAEERELEREALGEAAEQIGSIYSGVMLGSIVHDLAVMRALGIELDEIDQVHRWPQDARLPSLSVAARTSEGTMVNIGWHYLDGYPEYREEIRWHDSHGSLELTFPTPYRLHAPTFLDVRSVAGTIVEETRRHSPVEAFEQQLLAFHAMARGGVPPKAGYAEGAADIVTCQRMATRLAETEKLVVGGEAGSL